MSRSHLLLVDDDTTHLGLLEVGLREAGFDITTANDGASALDRALEHGPDLVLGELDLPALDGFSLLEAMRAYPRIARIPAIFLTAQKDVEHRARALERGAADHLSKPVFVKELVARVRLHLQRRERESLLDETGSEAAGTLADQGLADLVRALGTRTGTIACESDRGETARLFVTDGRIVDASAGAASGESAFRRALSWRDGRWRFSPGAHGRLSTISRDAATLLNDALQGLKIRDARLTSLGGESAVFEVDFVAVAFRLADLPEAAHGVLRLVDGRRSLEALLKASALDETTTLATLDQLLREGVVRPAPLAAGTGLDVEEEPATMPVLLDEEGRRLRGPALARALARMRNASLVRQAQAPAAVVEETPVLDAPPAVIAPEPVASAPEPVLAEAPVEPAAEIIAAPVVVEPEPTAPEPAPIALEPVASAPEPVADAEPLVVDRPPEIVEPASAEAFELRECPECRAQVSADALVCDACGCVLVETTDFSSLLGQARENVALVPEVVPVVRFPARRGARRERLEKEAREALAAASFQGVRPEPLTRELVAPGVAPHPELVNSMEASGALMAAEPPPVLAAAETPDSDPELEAFIAQSGKSKGPQIAAALVALAAAVGFLMMRSDPPPAQEETKTTVAAMEEKPAEPVAPIAPEPVAPAPQELAAAEPEATDAGEPAPSPEPAPAAPEEAAAAPAPTTAAPETKPAAPEAPVATPIAAAAVKPAPAPVAAPEPPEPVAPAPALAITAKPVAPAPAPVVAPAAKPTAPAPVVAPAPKPAAPAPVAAPAPKPAAPAPVAAPAPKPAAPAPVAAPAPKPAAPAPVVAPAPKPAPMVVPLEPKPKPEPKPAAEPAEVVISPAAAGSFDKLYAEGAAAVKAEKWPKAIAALQKAIKIKPDGAASRELGKAYYSTDKLDAAKQSLEQATRLDAGDAEAYLFLGMVLTDLEQKPEAKRAYQRFLALEPPGSARAREINTVLKTLER